MRERVGLLLLSLWAAGAGMARAQEPTAGAKAPDQILLKDHEPVSIEERVASRGAVTARTKR